MIYISKKDTINDKDYDIYYNKYPFAKTDAVDFESLDNKYLKQD